MQFISGLFGGSGNTILTMVLALGVVLVLIVLAVWLLKLIANVSGNAARGRNKRLAVVDTLVLDQKRQLIIVRRDDVQHLILTGGPQDVVVETGITAPEAPAVAPARRTLPPAVNRLQSEAAPVAPVPVAPVQPAQPAVQPAKPVEAAPGTLLEQLQKSGHTGDRKARVTLRQTGLLRPGREQPATVTVHNPDSPTGLSADSAKQGGNDEAREGDALEQHAGDQVHRS